MIRRSTACALALCLTLLAGCGAPSGDPGASFAASASLSSAGAKDAGGPALLRIPYDAGDTLNPYTCYGLQNCHAANLLFDGLVTLDPAYHPELRLAQELTREGAQWVARLRPGLLFSDGSPITSEDVASSFRQAAASPRYAASLEGVAEVQTPDEATIVFVLARADVYFDRALSFPILKAGTGALPLPIGCGRFLPPEGGLPAPANPLSGASQSSEAPPAPVAFAANPGYYDPVRSVRRVELVDMVDLHAQSYAVMDGTLDLFYSDLQSEFNVGLGTGYRQVPLSNLLFLGFGANTPLSDAPLRAVLSSLISRDDINRKTAMGFGSAAYSLVRPSYGGSASGVAETTPDRLAAALDAAGYGARDADGYRTAGGKRLSLTLLLSGGNQARASAANLVRGSLERAGIQVILEALPYADYLARVAKGDFDLYLGEIKIPYNLALDSLLGPQSSGELLALYRQVKAGEAPAIQLDALLRQELPVIPILYRRGILCFARDFSANIVASERDIFYNIGEW